MFTIRAPPTTTLRVEFPPALFTKDLAAHYLSLSTREIDELRSTGHLIAVGEGKRIKFTKAELDRYIERLPERSR